MILVTLGTHEQPFERALDLLSELQTGDEQVIVQHGTTPARPHMRNVRWYEYLDWYELIETMRRAEVVITHAGVGSLVTAIRAGKKPIMMPRLARFGEHVDDHQLQLAKRFAERQVGFMCQSPASLAGLVRQARRSQATLPARSSDLRSAIVDAASTR